jgi:predicted aconitase
LHIPANRRARVIVDVTGLSAHLRDSDVFYPAFGSWYGKALGETIGVIDGLSGVAGEDRLKAFGAAAAASGAVALFHVAGVTPEAADVAAALGAEAAEERIVVTSAMIASARDDLSTAEGDRIDAVAIGSPHLSFAEFEALAASLGGRRLAVPFYACTGRHVVRALDEAGRRTPLEAAGITIVADTCVVVTPILAEIAGVLMTNSGKFAHYAPGNTGYSVQFGSLEECVESAVAGKLVREGGLWN